MRELKTAEDLELFSIQLLERLASIPNNIEIKVNFEENDYQELIKYFNKMLPQNNKFSETPILTYLSTYGIKFIISKKS